MIRKGRFGWESNTPCAPGVLPALAQEGSRELKRAQEGLRGLKSENVTATCASQM